MARITVEELRLNAPNIDLQPSKSWRDLAKKGVRSMSYKVFARATLPSGEQIGVDLRIPALNEDHEIADIGTDEVPVIAGLLAKSDKHLDTLKLRYNADGSVAVDKDGAPVYAEAPVLQDDGQQFPSEYGTLYFCTLHGGVRITLAGVTLETTGRTTQGAKEGETIQVFAADAKDYRVERVAAAKGPSLLGRVKIGATSGGATRQAERAAGLASEAAELAM